MKRKALQVQLKKLKAKQRMKKVKRNNQSLEENTSAFIENDFYGKIADVSTSELFSSIRTTAKE